MDTLKITINIQSFSFGISNKPENKEKSRSKSEKKKENYKSILDNLIESKPNHIANEDKFVDKTDKKPVLNEIVSKEFKLDKRFNLNDNLILTAQFNNLKKSKELSINSSLKFNINEYKTGSINFTMTLLNNNLLAHKGFLHISKRDIFNRISNIQKVIELKKEVDTITKKRKKDNNMNNSLYLVLLVQIDYSEFTNLRTSIISPLRKSNNSGSNVNFNSKAIQKDKRNQNKTIIFNDNLLPVDDFNSDSTIISNKTNKEIFNIAQIEVDNISYDLLDDNIKKEPSNILHMFKEDINIISENIDRLLNNKLKSQEENEITPNKKIFFTKLTEYHNAYYPKLMHLIQESNRIKLSLEKYKKLYIKYNSKKQAIDDITLKNKIKRSKLNLLKQSLVIGKNSIDLNKEDIIFYKRLFKLDYNSREIELKRNLTEKQKELLINQFKQIVVNYKIDLTVLNQSQRNFVAEFVDKNELRLIKKPEIEIEEKKSNELFQESHLTERILKNVEIVGDNIEINDIDKRLDKLFDEYYKKHKYLKISIKKNSNSNYSFANNNLLIKNEKNIIKLSIGEDYLTIDKFLDKYIQIEELKQLRRNPPVIKSSKRLLTTAIK